MADKANKSSSIRLPEELRAGLKREAFARFSRGEVEPSYGDLLLEAWRTYIHGTLGQADSTAFSADPQKEAAERPGQVLQSGQPKELCNLSPSELTQVGRLLRILRSSVPGVSAAITSNLDTFQRFVDLHERVASGADPARDDAVTSTGEREQKRTRSGSGGSAALERVAGVIDRELGDVARELRDIEQSRNKKREGKGGAGGSAGKRRGA